MKSGRPMLVLLAALVAGCSSIRYNADFDPTVGFASYQTYGWVEQSDQASDRGMGPLVEQRVRSAIERELESRGYRKADSGSPDFLVNFYGMTEQKVDVDTYYTGWGYRGWYGTLQTDVREWTEGTLVIDIVDGAAKQVAWRGWAQGAVNREASPEQRTEKVNEAVAGILKQFPPSK